jgi:quercetin dioxygenase-like cupin family protein
MIYCAKGWARVVYEDQGPPFVLREGDCVVQPPGIRHRVLESSTGLEVIEVGSPADHETFVDHELPLPTPTVKADREFGGQRFVHHEAATAAWRLWPMQGFETRDLGIAAATGGIADARIVRARHARRLPASARDEELLFRFVLNGAATLELEDRKSQPLAQGDALVVPAQVRHVLRDCSDTFELLEVTLPAMTP